jgi:hypothetical protein
MTEGIGDYKEGFKHWSLSRNVKHQLFYIIANKCQIVRLLLVICSNWYDRPHFTLFLIVFCSTYIPTSVHYGMTFNHEWLILVYCRRVPTHRPEPG